MLHLIDDHARCYPIEVGVPETHRRVHTLIIARMSVMRINRLAGCALLAATTSLVIGLAAHNDKPSMSISPTSRLRWGVRR